MIGRNDPCSCGSGKKYKKCCGTEGTDLVDMIVNEELDRVLVGYFNDYPKDTDRQEMMQMMREWVNRLTGSWEKEHIEEAASEFYLFIHNKKIWHTYLAQQLEQMKRDSVISVLQKWDEPFMLLAEITEVESGRLKVRELFGERDYFVTRNEGMPADLGTLLFGVVLHDPRKGDFGVAPVSSMMFLAKWSKQTKKSLVELRDAVSDKSTEQFLDDHTLDIYELFIKRSMASMNELVEEVLVPTQLSALTALDITLRELNQSADGREIMHKLAVAYFLNENKDVPIEGDFLAAAVKTGIQLGVLQDTGLIEDDILRKYSASKEGMHLYEVELASLYADMMDSGDEPVAARLYDIGTDPRPTEKALWETSMTTGGLFSLNGSLALQKVVRNFLHMRRIARNPNKHVGNLRRVLWKSDQIIRMSSYFKRKLNRMLRKRLNCMKKQSSLQAGHLNRGRTLGKTYRIGHSCARHLRMVFTCSVAKSMERRRRCSRIY